MVNGSREEGFPGRGSVLGSEQVFSLFYENIAPKMDVTQ